MNTAPGRSRRAVLAHWLRSCVTSFCTEHRLPLMHRMTYPGCRRHLAIRLWVTLVLLSCSSVAWAEGTNSRPHSLIQHPPESSPARRLTLSPSQAQSNPSPTIPHTLLKKPTPPSPPLAPASAVPSVSSPQLGASAPSMSRPAMSRPVPTGIAPAPEADTSVGRSAAPLTSAAVSPRTETSRLPGPLQRLFRENPAFSKLLQVAPPVASTPPPPPTPPPTSSINSAILTWIPNTESDLAGYRIYVGTSSGNYDFPGSPFRVDKVSSYTMKNLQQKTTYFFAISAYDIAGNESPLSNEVSKSIF